MKNSKTTISRPKRTRISKRQILDSSFRADEDLPVLQGRIRPSDGSTSKKKNNGDECEVKNEPIDDELFGEESEDIDTDPISPSPTMKNEQILTFSAEVTPGKDQSSSEQSKDPIGSLQKEGNDNLKGHTDKMKYKCSICTKQYSYLANYNVHLRMHTGDRPFKCPHCPKTFPYEINLTQHIPTHFGERPYKCPHCPKSYARNGAYVSHIRKHEKGPTKNN